MKNSSMEYKIGKLYGLIGEIGQMAKQDGVIVSINATVGATKPTADAYDSRKESLSVTLKEGEA